MLFLDISFLHSRLRTCTLRKDFEGQAVLINCLLRNYLFYSLYDQVSHNLIFLCRKICLTKDFFQADKLVSKSVFPESGSNNEWSRYLYYLGRIKAIQLEYSQVETFEDENSKVTQLKLILKNIFRPTLIFCKLFAKHLNTQRSASNRLFKNCWLQSSCWWETSLNGTSSVSQQCDTLWLHTFKWRKLFDWVTSTDSIKCWKITAKLSRLVASCANWNKNFPTTNDF